MTSTRGNLRVDLNFPTGFRLRSQRLELIPAGAELAAVDWQFRGTLSALLGARVPAAWPPELVADADAAQGGWWDWYVVRKDDEQQPELVGVAGLKGWPSVTGSVQIGCSFLPQAQGKGYGTEAVEALTSWLLTQPGVGTVTANVPRGNEASAAILRKLGFRPGASQEGSMIRFERAR